MKSSGELGRGGPVGHVDGDGRQARVTHRTPQATCTTTVTRRWLPRRWTRPPRNFARTSSCPGDFILEHRDEAPHAARGVRGRGRGYRRTRPRFHPRMGQAGSRCRIRHHRAPFGGRAPATAGEASRDLRPSRPRGGGPDRPRGPRDRTLRRDGRARLLGVHREYLLLEYAKGDRLYVPSDQIDLVSKYIGGEAPRVSRLGSSDWSKTKARVRRKAKRDRAGARRSLCQAARTRRDSRSVPTRRGSESSRTRSRTRRLRTRCAPSTRSRTTWRRPIPMDRLVCGDVGYGKTEIAVRAAFKAVGRRQAGRGARADDDPGAAASLDLRRAVPPLAGARRDAVPLLDPGRVEKDRRGARRGQGRCRHRDAQALAARTSGSPTSAW